jgi:hypothetical protein
MPALYTYRIFVSHAWQYNEEYYRLIQYLDSAPNFSYANYSVPEHDPLAGGDVLGQNLRNQMIPVQVVLILAGVYATHSDWIQYEIDLAQQFGKPIVGIRPWGAERISSVVQKAAVEMVGWNTDSIVSA